MASRPKTVLAILTMASPLVLLGAIFPLCTALYGIVGNPETRTLSSGLEIPICEDSHYLQVLNGYCTRGVVVGIDTKKSCIAWSDSSDWGQIDETNKKNYDDWVNSYNPNITLWDSKSDYLADNDFKVTNAKAEVASFWPYSIYGSYAIIILSTFSAAMTFYASDIDLEQVSFDSDKLAIVVAIVIFFIVLVIISFFVYYTTAVSEIVQDETWSTTSCTYKVTPSFGYFLLMFAYFFAFIGFFFGILSYFRIYGNPFEQICGDVFGTKVSLKLTSVSPDPNQSGKKGLERTNSNNSVIIGPGGQLMRKSSSRTLVVVDSSDISSSDSDASDYNSSDDSV